MITALEASNNIGDLLTLSVYDISDGFSVRDITGIDPVKANIITSNFATRDGEQYQAAHRDKRNIVLKLGIEPDYSMQTVHQLRNLLYNFFMPKSEVLLRFYSDEMATVIISGRVESFESPIFTDNPEATISIINVNPDFEDPRTLTLTGNSVSNGTEQLIQYAGTTETGFLMKLNSNRNFSAFSIYSRGVDGVPRKMDFYASLLSGDVLEISTIPGQKGVNVIRAGTRVSVLYGLTPYSDWLSFLPGKNYFRVYADGAAIPYTINYTNKYGGL